MSDRLEFVIFFDENGVVLLELTPDTLFEGWDALHSDLSDSQDALRVLDEDIAISTLLEDVDGDYALFSFVSITNERNNEIIGGMGVGLSTQEIIDVQTSEQELGDDSFFQVTWFAPDGDIAATSFPDGIEEVRALFAGDSITAASEYESTNTLSLRSTVANRLGSYDTYYEPFGDYGIGFVGVSVTTAFADPVARNILIATVVAFVVVTIGFIALNWIGLWLGRQQDMQ